MKYYEILASYRDVYQTYYNFVWDGDTLQTEEYEPFQYSTLQEAKNAIPSTVSGFYKLAEHLRFSVQEVTVTTDDEGENWYENNEVYTENVKNTDYYEAS